MIAASVILHPTRKTYYFEVEWSTEPELLPRTLRRVRELWETEYRTRPVAKRPQQAHLTGSEAENEADASGLPDADDVLEWGRAPKRRKRSSHPHDGLDELGSYLIDRREDIDSSECIAWWLKEENQQRYPRLAAMAIDAAAIPAMSTEVKHGFRR
jgi:hypothetical protein